MRAIMLTLLPLLGCHGAQSSPVPVTIGKRTKTLESTFLAHGWEPWTASGEMEKFTSPALVKTLSHLRGQTIRFGGITADWLEYVMDPKPSPPCKYSRGVFTPGGQCPFSSGSFDALLDLVGGAGISLLFDLNELVGRNCSQPNPNKPGADPQWCGDAPAASWNTTSVLKLLQHIESRSHSGKAVPVAYELGNELFAPQHMPREAAVADISTLGTLFQQVWPQGTPPRIYASGTNDCKRKDSAEMISALVGLHEQQGLDTGFSFHSYPGNIQDGWNKSHLESFLLNSTWLRTRVLADASLCLAALGDDNHIAGASALPFAVTEAQSGCGFSFESGAPTTSSFINGFFSVANLGQMARAGAALVARWGIPDLLELRSGAFDATQVASDFFLYMIYARTVGPGVLRVSGDERSDVLVYAHCAPSDHFGSNGTVTVFAANPSLSPVHLSLSMPALPRLEYVLTAPVDDLAARTPVLNGEVERPLVLGSDGSLPRMEPLFCADAAQCAGGAGLQLPPRSQGFFVLLAAMANEQCGSQHGAAIVI